MGERWGRGGAEGELGRDKEGDREGGGESWGKEGERQRQTVVR